MNTTRPARTVAVVGAGAAGALAAAQLLTRAAAIGTRLDVALIDPAQGTGAGPAYRTRDDRHLLNIPAARMGAFSDDPGHFQRWLAARDPAASPDAYVPRAVYGQYIDDVLRLAARTSDPARLHRVHDGATALRRTGAGLTLALASGNEVRARAVVLALGGGPPSTDWADPALRASPRFVADPWAPGALDAVAARADARDVLLVGTGLTMADVAVTLAAPHRTLHAVSRHGLVPHAHRDPAAEPFAPCPLDGTGGLDALRRAIQRHLAACRRERGDWRPGLDGLRPLTAALWRQLPVADRARFLQEDLRGWEIHRHRLAPGTARRIDALRADGRLRVSPAEVTGSAPLPDGVDVRLGDGRRLTVSTVVNCTGPQGDWRRTSNPLVADLLRHGRARPGPAGLGLDTRDDGLLVPAAEPATPVWALGAARRGTLWETTAMPEIRAQAEEVAARVLAELAPDALDGPPLTTLERSPG